MGARELRIAHQQRRIFGYDPSEPRDDHGRWDSSGGDYGENTSAYTHAIRDYSPSEKLGAALDSYSQNHARLSPEERQTINEGFKSGAMNLPTGTVLYRGVETDKPMSNSTMNKRLYGPNLQSTSMDRSVGKEFAQLGVGAHGTLYEMHVEGKVPVLPVRQSGQSEFILPPLDHLVAYHVGTRQEGSITVHKVLIKSYYP